MDNDRLLKWQTRYEKAKSSYGDVLRQMDEREEYYRGTRKIARGSSSLVNKVKDASHIRNIVFELIESQIDSTIPWPKVTTKMQEFAAHANKIENSLKTDIERMQFEALNDEQERTTPIQGGSYFLVEWDNSIVTHSTVGDLTVSVIHPKNVIPQAGLYSINACDHVFVRLERTKDYIQNRYGVDVSSEAESEKGIDTTMEPPVSEDKVTQVLCYYKNGDGGIGLFSWVNDIIVEDLKDYQARQLDKCVKCGTEKNINANKCECGSKSFLRSASSEEKLAGDISISDNGQPKIVTAGTAIPYYKPDTFPLVLRKNVSMFGQLLGTSDIDYIRDQQNISNILGTKIQEKLVKGGSILAVPRGANYKKTDEEMQMLEFDDPGMVDKIRAVTLQPDISVDSMEREKAYQEAKSTLGITDTYQGKPDPTAVSGVAKQAQIQQATGRLESKRRMKNAAYSELYRLMFLFKLAYTDEPRPYTADGVNGQKDYGTFSRYDFLCEDAAGVIYYNDQFLFSTDPAGSLGQNRQAMWEETRKNFAQGAFGNPQEPQTLIMFWTLLESLNYPMASVIKAQIEQKIRSAQVKEQSQAPQMPPQQPQPMQAQPTQAQPIQQQTQQVQPPVAADTDIDSLLSELGV